MFKNPQRAVLIAATLVAMTMLLPVLPATLTAETEPRPSEIALAKASRTEGTSGSSPGEDKKSAREKVAGNKLVIDKPIPSEPIREPAPEEKPAPSERPALEPPVFERKPDKSRKRPVRAGATDVPVLPGPSRKTPRRPPAEPPAAKREEPRGNELLLSIPRLGLEDVLVGDSPKQSYLDREGIMHLSGTGLPSERGSNTYIAGHAADYERARVPNVFRNLHTMRQGDLITLRDAAGRTYEYRAYRYLIVDPRDVWVTEPVPGDQVVSFQTCYPAPTFEKRLIVRGILVNRENA